VPAGRPSGAPGTAAARIAPRPETIAFADVPAPDLRSADLGLPSGCSVEDYTDDLAAFSRRADPPAVTDSLGLLDLTTGRHAIVRAEAVNATGHWDVFAPRLSDGFLAWEEVTPGEGEDMGHAGWRLYAAPIDRDTLTVGAPLLVATGRTETVQRPFYGVDGTTVYWTRIASPGARRAGTPPDEVMARDLATGRFRTVYSAPSIDGFKLSAGTAVVTSSQTAQAGAPATSLVATAIRASDGRVLSSAHLGNVDPLSHFADYAGGWFVWTESVGGDSEPSAYAIDRAGTVTLMSLRSVNPMASPGYAFCESRETTGAPSARGDVRVLRGFDLAAGTRFELARTVVDTDGIWHTTVAGSRPRTLVVYNDGWVMTGAETTPVRVYRW
jgi:hypothetical protein